MHIRRVVTANGPDGKSRVIFDGAPGNTIEPVAGLRLSDIWETTAGEIDKGRIVFLRFSADVFGKVRSDGNLLVPWSLEIIAEAAR